MINPKAQKIIETLKKDLAKKGIVAEEFAKQLRDLRPYAIEEEDPTLTKVIRLTYEHLDEHGTFNIAMPGELEEDEEGNEIEVKPETDIEDDFEAKRVSLDYLFEIFLDNRNKYNRVDLIEYRDRLMA